MTSPSPQPGDPERELGAAAPTKRPYHAPQLTELGPLAELTRTGPTYVYVSGDGGTPPNVYPS